MLQPGSYFDFLSHSCCHKRSVFRTAMCTDLWIARYTNCKMHFTSTYILPNMRDFLKDERQIIAPRVKITCKYIKEGVNTSFLCRPSSTGSSLGPFVNIRFFLKLKILLHKPVRQWNNRPIRDFCHIPKVRCRRFPSERNLYITVVRMFLGCYYILTKRVRETVGKFYMMKRSDIINVNHSNLYRNCVEYTGWGWQGLWQ